MKVGIIGCGKIGQKRAQAVMHSDSELVAVCDIEFAAQYDLSEKYNVNNFTHYRDMLEDADIDTVIVATTHNMLATIAKDAIDAGKRVLIEKPGAINLNALEPLFRAPKGKIVRVGYNLRFHPAVLKALVLMREIGEVMYVRGYYGHGGRPGYEKEWRFDKAQSGGGVVMDLGVHLIDLSNLFINSTLNTVESHCEASFWKTTLEDNASFVLTYMNGCCAYLQASCTEWRNNFWLEIVGKKGKLCIKGLGGSYGTETLTLYKMTPALWRPEITTWGFSDVDNSWDLEWKDFEKAVTSSDGGHGASVHDAGWVLDTVERIYDYNKSTA